MIKEAMPQGLASLQIGDQLFVNSLIKQKEDFKMNSFNNELKHLYQSDRDLFAVGQELDQLVIWINEAVNQGRLREQQADDITTLAHNIQINLNGSRCDLQATYHGIKSKCMPLVGEVN